jgi:DNA-directed RNA polymerase subunit RPC12/RpoP
MSPEINFKTRNSRVARRVEIWFREHRDEDISFGAIMDKYCEVGMSRALVAKLLMDMKKRKGSGKLGDDIEIKDTPLWEAWKAEVAQGRCSFTFDSKFPGNKFHGNKGKTRKRRRVPSRDEQIAVVYACLECEHNFTEETGTTGEPKHIIALKARQCPSCKKYGTCVGRFKIGRKTMHKAVIDGTEQFVKSKGKKLVPIKRQEKEAVHG